MCHGLIRPRGGETEARRGWELPKVMVRESHSQICISRCSSHTPLLPSLLLVQNGPANMWVLGWVPGQLCQTFPKAKVSRALIVQVVGPRGE